MTFLLGAYAAAPGDPASSEFAAFLDALTRHRLVGGLELPSHHLLDERTAALIAEHGAAGWNHAVTCFPGTMFALADDPQVGLASPSARGRAAAVAFVDKIRAGIDAFAALGGGTIGRLLLHSAPRTGDPDALAASLDEIAGWDWRGIRLHLEHCDAASPGNPAAQKGFLTLEQELAVLADHPDVGLVINWGRSAIETRSAQGVLDQLTRVRTADRLSGLMFSGVAATDTAYGAAWLDAHLPSSTVVAGSLLTPKEVDAAVRRAGPEVFLGAKVGVQPPGAGVADRVAVLDQVLTELDDAARTGRHID